MVKAIKTMSAVLVKGGLTDEFKITTGVLQGDTLAPFFFIIVITYVLKKAQLNHARAHDINKGENGFVTQPRQCPRQPVRAIFDLDLADDLDYYKITYKEPNPNPTKLPNKPSRSGSW